MSDIYNYKKYPFWVECSKFNESECIKILNYILLNDINPPEWVKRLLIDSQNRLDRYVDSIEDNGERYFAYWRLKKIKLFLSNSIQLI